MSLHPEAIRGMDEMCTQGPVLLTPDERMTSGPASAYEAAELAKAEYIAACVCAGRRVHECDVEAAGRAGATAFMSAIQ